ncbi:cell wall hydrolase [Sphingomonas sp. GCM10030256]|uniref:cell wall hydrolase n=1 Tax=Sphingomonas sp. GCM10030256 TaxID=3273427 RepID=UPI0036217BEB
MAASSVAPAQVAPQSAFAAKSTAIAMNDVLPTQVLQPVANTAAADPLAPASVEEQPAAEQPVEDVTAGATLSETVAKFRSSDPGSRELECLAVGIYFESKSEPLSGQLAVGEVIANRANSKGRFPSSYCGVLFQRGQFSFVKGGRWPAVAKGGAQWKNAVAIAKIVDKDLHDSSVGKALFFHARRVSPGWRLTRVATVGNHVFYR